MAPIRSPIHGGRARCTHQCDPGQESQAPPPGGDRARRGRGARGSPLPPRRRRSAPLQRQARHDALSHECVMGPWLATARAHAAGRHDRGWRGRPGGRERRRRVRSPAARSDRRGAVGRRAVGSRRPLADARRARARDLRAGRLGSPRPLARRRTRRTRGATVAFGSGRRRCWSATRHRAAPFPRRAPTPACATGTSSGSSSRSAGRSRARPAWASTPRCSSRVSCAWETPSSWSSAGQLGRRQTQSMSSPPSNGRPSNQP